jgi:hypothetical protein
MGADFGAVTAISNDTTSPITGNHTIGADDNVVYVRVAIYTTGAFLGTFACTYGGVAMTLIKDLHGANGYIQDVVFRLSNPASGSQAISFTWGSGTPLGTLTHVISLNGADVSGTPERTVYYDASSDVNPADASVTIADAEANDCILSFGQWAASTTGSLTAPSGATLRASTVNSGVNNQRALTYTEAVESTGSQVNAFSVNVSTRTNQIAFAVKGKVTGGQVIMWDS